MRLYRIGIALVLAAVTAMSTAACADQAQSATASATGTIGKGGDDRTGGCDGTPSWWKTAPDHDSIWRWGEVSGLAVDNPNRIIVAVWGDRNAQNQERPNSTNYLVVADKDCNIAERWSQWDSITNRPHQVY